MSIKRLVMAVAFVSSSLLVGAPAISSVDVSADAVETEDEQWSNPNDATFGYHGLVIEDQPQGGGEDSSTISYLRSYPDAGGNQYLCSSVDDPRCSPAFDYGAVLGPCVDEADVDCIVSVSAISQSDKISSGVFKEYFPKLGVNDFIGSRSTKVPSGKTPSLWEIAGATHSGGALYGVTVQVAAQKSSDGRYSSAKRRLSASLVPVSKFQTDCRSETSMTLPNGELGKCLIQMYQNVDSNGISRVQTAGPASDFGKYRCALWGDDSVCALRHAFPKRVRYEIKLRLALEPNGWTHGRLGNPEVRFETTADKSVVTIAADPVSVPIFAAWGQWSSLPANVQAWINKTCISSSSPCGTRNPNSNWTDPLGRNVMLGPPPYKSAAFEQVELWKDHARDSAVALVSTWALRTLSEDEMSKAPDCVRNGSGVTGVVSTNATVYSEGPPLFDSTSKTLKYQVAAAHYEKDGKTEFKGDYNLLVREDIAECLYKFSESFAAKATNYIAEEEPFTEAQGADDFSDASFEEVVDPSQTDAEQFERPQVVDWTLEDMEEADLTTGLEYKTLDDGTVVKVKPYNRLEDGTEVDTGAELVYEPVRPVVASIDAEVLSALQKAAPAKTKIKLEDGWFHFSATDFTFSQPTVAVEFGATPASSIRCVSGSSLKVVTSVKPSCPTGYATAVTRYCAKGKKIDAVIAAKPMCPRGFKAAQVLRCAKGLAERRVIAVSPKCPKSFRPMSSFVCIKGDQARRITSAVTTCAPGWAKATTVSCAKGKKKQTVTGIKPTCPKGFKKR